MYNKEAGKIWRKSEKFKAAKRRENKSVMRRRPHAQRLRHIRRRCKTKNLAYNLDENYLNSIQTKVCPVFNTVLNYSISTRMSDPNGAELDRMIPSLGYIKGNVKFISLRANRIKYDASVEEIEQILKYMKAI
jgi:hypothetical protein